MNQKTPSEKNISMENVALQQSQSEKTRAIIKRYYIYFVLALVVVVFSVVRLDEVNWFERGHFLNPNNIINLLRICGADHDRRRRLHLPDDRRIY